MLLHMVRLVVSVVTQGKVGGGVTQRDFGGCCYAG